MDGETFREMLVDTLHQMFPNWTDETLVQHPVEAIRYCAVARHRVKSQDIPDDFFLRWLMNTRKNEGLGASDAA